MISPSGSEPDESQEKGNLKRAARNLEDHLFMDMRPEGISNMKNASAGATVFECMESLGSQFKPLAGKLLTDDTHKKTGYSVEMERGSSTFKHTQLTNV